MRPVSIKIDDMRKRRLGATVLQRWLTVPRMNQDQHDLQMLKLSKRYSTLYTANVYMLNKVGFFAFSCVFHLSTTGCLKDPALVLPGQEFQTDATARANQVDLE